MLSKLRHPKSVRTACLVVVVSLCSCAALTLGYWLGNDVDSPVAAQGLPLEFPLPQLQASTAAASDTMAVATGQISEDTEGIFFLDFITGDLQCLVYYPRFGYFGARYYTNVVPQLGGAGKNAQYIMVTGGAIQRQTSGQTRPAASLVYVTDAKTGMFAAYAIPWNRTAESAGATQSGQLIYVGGGPVRNFQLANPNNNQPAAVVDPNKQNP